jgi:hypothetical protein
MFALSSTGEVLAGLARAAHIEVTAYTLRGDVLYALERQLVAVPASRSSWRAGRTTIHTVISPPKTAASSSAFGMPARKRDSPIRYTQRK